MLKTDLTLSCGHVQIVSVEAASAMPHIGEVAWCERCQKERGITDPGIAWIDEDAREVPKPTEGQLPLWKEDGT